MSQHVVQAVHFTSGTDGVVTCACGASSTVREYQEHRKAAGERPLALSEAATGELPEGALGSRKRGAEAARRSRAEARRRELQTGCPPEGEPGMPCRNCGHTLMLGGKRTRDGRRLVQHAPRRRVA